MICSFMTGRRQVNADSTTQVLPPLARVHSPADTIPVRHLHQSIGKSKKPITVVRWTPEGRRLLTGGHTGEFMLWNGTAFNFETVMDVSRLQDARCTSEPRSIFANHDDDDIRPTTTNIKLVSRLLPGRTAMTGSSLAVKKGMSSTGDQISTMSKRSMTRIMMRCATWPGVPAIQSSYQLQMTQHSRFLTLLLVLAIPCSPVTTGMSSPATGIRPRASWFPAPRTTKSNSGTLALVDA